MLSQHLLTDLVRRHLKTVLHVPSLIAQHISGPCSDAYHGHLGYFITLLFTVYSLSNGVMSNKLELPLTRVSRSRYFVKVNISRNGAFVQLQIIQL